MKPPIKPSDLARVMSAALALMDFRVEELSALSGVDIGTVIRVITDNCSVLSDTPVFTSATSSVIDMEAGFKFLHDAEAHVAEEILKARLLKPDQM